MIASFDLGMKNFAFAVYNNGDYVLLKLENLNSNVTISDLKKLKKKDLIDLLSEKMENLDLKQTIKKDEIISMVMKTKTTKKQDLGIELFKTMDMYKDYWEKCEVFLIERQMMVNRQALKLSHYLEAYLKIHYPLKKILNYNSSFKTKKLGSEKFNTKKDRKNWTINYASSILKDKNLSFFNNASKKDDIADVICMIESYIL